VINSSLTLQSTTLLEKLIALQLEKKLLRILWNLKVHKRLPCVSVTMQIKSTPSHSVGLRYILISSHISLRLPNVLSFKFPLRNPVQISLLPHTCLMDCKSRPAYLIFWTKSGEVHKWWSSSIRNFLQSPITAFLLGTTPSSSSYYYYYYYC
jgi:hypothetical protein